MKNRIKEVMEYANLSQQDFAARLGISAASLSSIFTGRTNPTNNHVSAIHRAFPEINVNWIMFGEGNMICGNAQSEEQEEGAIDLEGDGAERMLEADGQSSVSSGLPDAYAQSHVAENRMGTGNFYQGGRTQTAIKEMSTHASRQSSYGFGIRMDRPQRKIKEIRVFFDDGTYEAFVPSNKN